MGFRKDEDYEVSETGNWNVASDYSKLKIMKNLYLADEYSNVAKFGSSSIIEEIDHYINNIPLDVLRIKGFERLVNCLILLIDNSLFAIKHKTDITKLEGYRGKLMTVQSLIPMLYNTNVDQINRTRQVKINTERFNKLLNEVDKIKYLINDPLNKSHLIFTDKEEFDPIEYKKQVMHDAVTRG